MDNPDWSTPGPSCLSDEMHGDGNWSNMLDENDALNHSSNINYGTEEIKNGSPVITLTSSKERFSYESNSSSESVYSVSSSNATSCAATILTDPTTQNIKLQSILKRTFQCRVCNYVSFNEKETKRHIKKEHTWNSSADGFNSQSNSELAANDDVEGKYQHTCDECSYKTNNASRFFRHQRLHTWLEEKDTLCKDSSPKLEKKHLIPHQPQSVKRSGDSATEPPSVKRPKRFYCEYCKFSSEESCTMFRHQFLHDEKSHTSIEAAETNTTIFNCWNNDCSFFCDTLEIFKRHQDFHDEKYRVLFDLDQGEPVFNCPVCSFSCAKFEYIVLHWEIHSASSKNFEQTNEVINCNISSFTSANIQTLNRHIDKHLEKSKDITNTTEPEKQEFKCNVCSFACANKQFLDLHLNRHSTRVQDFAEAEDPSQMEFHCSICDVAYEREKDLLSHEECHVALSEEYEQFQNEEQIFKCKKCSNSYTEKVYLDLHQKVHNEMFKCLYCGKGFKYRKILNKHMKKCK